MALEFVDWCLVIGYGVIALVIGVALSRRAGQNVDEYFVAGRSLPWWVAGTSIVATSFAADTPLVVSGLIRKQGIHGNWIWWYVAVGGMLCAVFFARLWRRAGVLTDVELIELRYEGRSASVLRGFLAVYGGVFVNCITMMWVMLAMANVCEVMLGWPKGLAVAVLALVTLAYTVLSGFWGVVMTDMLQFVIALAGSVALAVIVVGRMGGPAELVARVEALEGVRPDVLNLTPVSLDAVRELWSDGGDLRAVLERPLATFVILLAVMWWGAGQGGGYLAQRLFATRNERHAMLAALWFNFAHYVLRPWPWIMVGVASLVWMPLAAGENPEMAYPAMMRDFLPAGLRGLLLASFLAAFMSTIDTQLNWGSSYLVNDLYRRFIAPDRSPRHYVQVSRLSCVALIALAATAAMGAEHIMSAWIYLAVLGSGAAAVGLLRWYWWRLNAWSEISALIASVVIANVGHLARLMDFVLPAGVTQRGGWVAAMDTIQWLYSDKLFAVRGLMVIVVCTLVWLTVTLLTRPVPAAHLERFFRRVRPGGWWGPVAAACPDVRRDRGLGKRWLAWVSGVTCVYAGLFGVGHLCLDRPAIGVVHLLGCLGAGWLMLTLIGAEERRAGTS